MVFKVTLLAGLAVLVAWIALSIKETPKIPDVDANEWWGSGAQKTEDTSIRNFKIGWSVDMISDLKNRLVNRRPLTPPLENVNFEYGFNTKALEPILDYWSNKYNFTDRLQYLNQFPQYKTKIQGLDIHFIWEKPTLPSKVKVIPLLLLHGWPGSVREFYEAIPLLTQQRPGYDFVFEVVVPSLVGFGYSDAAARPGMGTATMAVVMRNLMHRLGYQQFYIQGGDWGSIITSDLATLFPEEVLGYHTNMPTNTGKTYLYKLILGSILPWYLESPFAARVYPLSKHFSLFLRESGYFHIQATKPDTIGVALNDSPTGLAAYLLEKFSSGTNLNNIEKPDGGLSEFKIDDLLDNLMVYWDSGSITTSLRLYAEQYSTAYTKKYNLHEVPTPVPTWAMHTANEPLFYPSTLLSHKYTNLLDISMMERGGHFIAFELPREFTEDVFRAVRSFVAYHKNKVLKL